jgi:hypothetical protein
MECQRNGAGKREQENATPPGIRPSFCPREDPVSSVRLLEQRDISDEQNSYSHETAEKPEKMIQWQSAKRE